MIDPKQIAKLRSQTGAGVLACKVALEESEGDIDKAVEILKKKGIKFAKKRIDKETREGLIHAYIHANGRIGVLIEVACETDFVARNQEFRELVHDLAMQVAATDPLYLGPDDVPEEVIKKEKDVYRADLEGEIKEEFLEKAIEGKIQKYYEEACLLKQPFIKDEEITIEDLINQKIGKLGEKIEIKRFVRFEI